MIRIFNLVKNCCLWPGRGKSNSHVNVPLRFIIIHYCWCREMQKCFICCLDYWPQSSPCCSTYQRRRPGIISRSKCLPTMKVWRRGLEIYQNLVQVLQYILIFNIY